jgi:hypothetical protein
MRLIRPSYTMSHVALDPQHSISGAKPLISVMGFDPPQRFRRRAVRTDLEMAVARRFERDSVAQPRLSPLQEYRPCGKVFWYSASQEGAYGAGRVRKKAVDKS